MSDQIESGSGRPRHHNNPNHGGGGGGGNGGGGGRGNKQCNRGVLSTDVQTNRSAESADTIAASAPSVHKLPKPKAAVAAKSNSHRPNFFVALKLADSPCIIQAIVAIQNQMAARCRAVSASNNTTTSSLSPPSPSWIEKCFTPASKAHFTFNVFCVDDKKSSQCVDGVIDLTTAIRIFTDTKKLVYDCLREHIATQTLASLPTARRLEFGRLDSFGEAVVFLGALKNPAYELLHKIQDVVCKAFVEVIGGDCTTDRKWQAHVTVAKTSKGSSNKVALKREYYEGLDSLLDRVACDMVSIDLLSMSETDEHGYYKSYASYSLGESVLP